MGATEEQMALLTNLEVTHVSYILLLYSVAFLLFLFVNVLVHIYSSYIWPVENKKLVLPKDELHANGAANGHINAKERQQARDAEEFELTGLMSDEDGEISGGSASGRRKETI
jgi:hypothetical protein